MNSLSKRNRERLQKAFSVLTGVTTTLSLSGVAYFAPVAFAATPADYGLKEGDVISAAGSADPDVYIVNEQGYKRLFLNPAIFAFYGHLGGFAAVKSVSPATRDAFGTSGLFRNCETNDPKVYGVETTGEDTGMLHWVNTSGAQAVVDDANFFKKVFCVNSNEFNWYSKGADYTSVNQVPSYSRGAPTPSAGPISASLASDSPATGTIVDGQARYDFAHYVFSGSGKVTSLKLKRIGVSADASLTNVYLYDGARRLTDSATVSSGVISFSDTSGLFEVSGSKAIWVLADVDGTSGETIGVQLSEVNGSAVSLSGNLHTIATATLATTALASSTTPSANTALDPASDAVAWQNTVTIGNRYVWLKSLQFRVIGSVLAGDLQNFRLFVDGVRKGPAVAQAETNGFVVFDMSGDPAKLETGGRVVKLLVDVVSGSNRNFTISLRQASDIWTVDSQYGSSVLATAGGSFPVDAGKQDVSQGTLTITKKTNSPSGDVVKDASGVVFATYEFKAAGERMKVENLRVSFTSSRAAFTELRNGAIFADGVQVGSTQDIEEDSETTPYTQYSLGSSLIVEPGKPKTVEIRADVFDGDGTNDTTADDTITVNIATGASNVQRLVSLNFVNGPASNTAANQVTVKTGSMTVGKYTGYADQSVVDPKTGVKVGHFTLTAASAEDVNVNTIDITGTGTGGFDEADLTNVSIKVWNDGGLNIYTSPVKSTISTTASNSYSVNFTVPKNKTYQVEVWADVGSGITTGDTLNLEFDAIGTTAGSSTTANVTRVTGQKITAQAGSLTKATGVVPSARLANGGQTLTTYSFTLQPTFDDFTLQEVYVDLSATTASSTGAVANLLLKDGATTLSSATVVSSTGSASFTGLNYLLAQSGGTKTLTVDVQLANVGVGANDTGGLVKVRLDGLKFNDSAGTVTTEKGYSTTTFTGNNIVVHKAYPTVSNASLPATTLSAGTKTLFKTVIGSSGSSIVIRKLTFSVQRTVSNPTVAESSLKLFENGVNVTSLGTIATASNDLDSAGANTAIVAFEFTNDRAVSTGTTYELVGDVGGTLATGNAIVTKIANPSSTNTTEDYATVEGTLSTTSPSLIWSDSSAPSHSDTTDDWMNDYLLQTINVSQTLQVP